MTRTWCPIGQALLVVVVCGSALAYGLADDRTVARVPAGMNSVGPITHVGPVSRPCGGVTITATDRVQDVIDSHPPGTTFCLRPGLYRLETPLVPKSGDALIGHRGAVLNGSKVLSGWRMEGGVWQTKGYLPSEPNAHGTCDASTPTCTYTEDVFLDKKRLRRVSLRSELIGATFFADYRANTVLVGEDPRERLVEQAVAPSLIRATVNDVIIANLVLEQAANEAQIGAIEARQITPATAGSGWRIGDNEVRQNHGVGISSAGSSTVSGNFVHDQGQLGIGAEGNSSSVSNNEVAFNGGAGYDAEWEAGGIKSWLTEGLVLEHNLVHDNVGPGIWSDGGCLDTTYEYNKIVGNWGAGLAHEISYDAVISRNEIAGNGRRKKGWAWDAGILINSSGGNQVIDISENVVTENGIALVTTTADGDDRTQERPAPHGPHVVANVWVHDNVVTMSGDDVTGLFDDTDNRAIFTGNRNRFDTNTYYLGSLADPHFAWSGLDLDWMGWREPATTSTVVPCPSCRAPADDAPNATTSQHPMAAFPATARRASSFVTRTSPSSRRPPMFGAQGSGRRRSSNGVRRRTFAALRPSGAIWACRSRRLSPRPGCPHLGESTGSSSGRYGSR